MRKFFVNWILSRHHLVYSLPGEAFVLNEKDSSLQLPLCCWIIGLNTGFKLNSHHNWLRILIIFSPFWVKNSSHALFSPHDHNDPFIYALVCQHLAQRSCDIIINWAFSINNWGVLRPITLNWELFLEWLIKFYVWTHQPSRWCQIPGQNHNSTH